MFAARADCPTGTPHSFRLVVIKMETGKWGLRGIAFGLSGMPAPGDINYQICAAETNNAEKKVYAEKSYFWEY